MDAGDRYARRLASLDFLTLPAFPFHLGSTHALTADHEKGERGACRRFYILVYRGARKFVTSAVLVGNQPIPMTPG